MERANGDLLQVASTHGIAPHRCVNCRQTCLSWGFGYDDGTDPGYVGFQCQTCGNVQGLTASTIRRRVRAAAR
jgi:hypothetical protein